MQYLHTYIPGICKKIQKITLMYGSFNPCYRLWLKMNSFQCGLATGKFSPDRHSSRPIDADHWFSVLIYFESANTVVSEIQ